MTTDFLLGMLKGILQRRPTLKLVLMSATINSVMFSEYFGRAPVIEVPGRVYTVEIEYVPQKEDPDLLNDRFFHQRRASSIPVGGPSPCERVESPRQGAPTWPMVRRAADVSRRCRCRPSRCGSTRSRTSSCWSASTKSTRRTSAVTCSFFSAA